jgi:hypothetical protein
MRARFNKYYSRAISLEERGEHKHLFPLRSVCSFAATVLISLL